MATVIFAVTNGYHTAEVGIANSLLSSLIANPLIYFRGPLNANPLIFILKSAKR